MAYTQFTNFLSKQNIRFNELLATRITLLMILVPSTLVALYQYSFSIVEHHIHKDFSTPYFSCSFITIVFL